MEFLEFSGQLTSGDKAFDDAIDKLLKKKPPKI
jgi:hypothetical protein